jgi:hypothetical protein
LQILSEFSRIATIVAILGIFALSGSKANVSETLIFNCIKETIS